MAKDRSEVFLHPEYWNEQYAQEDDKNADSYDWLSSLTGLQPLLIKHLPVPGERPTVLHLGSGNSTIPMDLQTMGYAEQTAVDFSDVIINKMATQHSGIDWRVMDVRWLAFSDDTFDLCFDKTTLDSMLYGSLWNPPDEVKRNVEAYVNEVLRVLKPGGQWLYITWRQPHFIRPLLERDGRWSMEVESLTEGGGLLEYFAYTLKKTC